MTAAEDETVDARQRLGPENARPPQPCVIAGATAKSEA